MLGLGLSLTGLAMGRGRWTPARLFASGQPGYWPGGYAPSSGRLYQDAAGVTPAATYGQPVGLSRRQAGTVDPSQATALSRPTLARWPIGGRRNLLTWTEDFSNAVWTKGASITFGSDATGTFITSGAAFWSMMQTVAANLPREAVRYASTEFKASGTNFATLLIGTPSDTRVGINLMTGETAVISTPADAGNVIAVRSNPLEDGWWRVEVDYNTATAFSPTVGSKYAVLPSTTLAGNGAPVGSSVYARNLASNDKPGPYQRVTTAYDITEAGVPDVWHLSNDGGDSLPVSLPAGTYGRACVDAAGVVVVDSVTNPSNALVPSAVGSTQADVILRQGAFSPEEDAQIRAYWGGLYA